jgi:guanidinopropionase
MRHPKPIDSSVTPRFSGVATFMRLPQYDTAEELDIAVFGVPFDLGSSFSGGQRFAPAKIREHSRLIRQVNSYSKIAPFDLCRVADVGDAPINPIDLMDSIGRIETFVQEIHDAGALPLAAGGDHMITLPILRRIAAENPVGIVQFDAHPDTLDELLGSRYNHATPVRRAVEEGLIDPRRSLQIGLRGTCYSPNDFRYGSDVGMRVITMDEYEELGRVKVIEEIQRVCRDGPIYITFDIDGLDPAFAPGVGTPEPGGLTMRDAQVMLRGMRGLNVIGGDLVEMSPPFDASGTTAINASNIMFEILCLMADSKDRAAKRPT